ncbi:matrixin family metalloprotease [Lacipirellula sp.]|uniref:matrixin family metalloprotease n=1 Tax=Lacipirellula sp. TaxID=2691419 RepID=UPI003D12D5C0
MPHHRSHHSLPSAAITAMLGIFVCTNVASAYIPDDRWSTTASGSTGTNGDIATITWSLVADGTSIVSEGPSNLISYMDGLFGSSGGSNLTTRPWFSLFQDSFDRWTELGGIKFVYEPNDNGVQMGGNTAGVLGVRGDIRIGGANIDGANGTLAYTYLPNNGDMVVDTGETNFYNNSANNYLQLRNTITHELGHAFGLLHIESSSDHLLMEPYIDTSFDGPQLDDIRGLHGLYGDAFEKTNNGAGNDSYSLATSLGAIAAGGSKSIGTAAATGQAVGPDETDFVSIANSNDFDFFSFTVNSASLLTATLTPLGGVFTQGAEGGAQSTFDANARNDLSLAIYGTNGTTLLGTANNTAAGFAESLASISLPAAGQYYVRVAGSTANVQLYQLQLSVASAIATQPGDFDGDGVVDGDDFLVWQRAFGTSGTGLAADGNNDGQVDALDLAIFKQHFGESLGNVIALTAAVPEPAAATLLFFAATMFVPRKAKRLVRE